MKAKSFRSGERVRFVAGNGKVYEGVVVNGSFYPGGSRAGKHFRINVGGGVIATVFAQGPVGRSVEKVQA